MYLLRVEVDTGYSSVRSGGTRKKGEKKCIVVAHIVRREALEPALGQR
jgi:hypothetical protein